MGDESETAVELEEVRPGIYRLPLAIPFEVGPVNAWVIRRAGQAVLIDTGPKTDAAWSALVAHLAAIGLAPADLAHVVITHAHVDHHGNLGRIVEARPDVVVHCHEDDAAAIAGYHASLARSTGSAGVAMLRWGMPEAALASAERFRASFTRYGDDVPRSVIAPIRGARAAIAIPALELTAIHCPGHAEGLIVVSLEPDEPGGERLLFSSDCVLERITPNPTIYPGDGYRGRRTGLAHYLESLRVLRDEPCDLVLPGHGRAFPGLARRIDEIFAHHDERQEAVLELVRAAPRTIFEVVLDLWPGLPAAQHYLACREVDGHLDLLVEAGRVSVDARTRGSLYRAA